MLSIYRYHIAMHSMYIMIYKV